jgi:sugar (pentulose or hexulose) kinase
MKADVLGVPVVRMADHELTTLGLAVIASTALGIHASHATAARCFVAEQRRFEPCADAAPLYAAARARYLACAQALLPTFALYAPAPAPAPSAAHALQGAEDARSL